MSKSLGVTIVERCLDDSYYPDLGLTVSAESVVREIEDSPEIQKLRAEKVSLEKDVSRLVIEREGMLESLIQSVDQMKRDYNPTFLDGHAALIRKLEAVITKAKGA